jgi:hypothetical protein
VQKPINLANPKKQAAPSNVTQRHLVLYGAAALTAVFLFVAMILSHVYAKSEIARLQKEKQEGESVLSMNGQELADVDAYREWEQTTVPWLDELYDLSARNPYKEKLRINQLHATTVASVKKGTVKDRAIGKISIRGVDPSDPKGDKNYLFLMLDPLKRDPHLTVTNTQTTLKDKLNEFSFDINVYKQEAKRYTTQLVVPPRPVAQTTKAKEDPPPDGPDEGDPEGGNQ